MRNRQAWSAPAFQKLVAVIVISSCSVSSFAADRPKAAAAAVRSVVDQVAVRGGPKLRGMLFAQAEDKSVTLLVSAKWLKSTNAESFAKQQRKTLDAHSP